MQSFEKVLSFFNYFKGLHDLVSPPKEVWVVDNDAAQYPTPDFATIQEAINAASPGDTILVFPGTYPESLTIPKALTLYGNGAFVHPTPSGRTEGESILTGAYPVSVSSSAVSINGFEITDFRYGLHIPAAAFAAPDYQLSQITFSYNWLHSEDAWVGINAEGGTLSHYEISHSIIDIHHTSTQEPAYALAAISFSGQPDVPAHYNKVSILSNVLRNRSAYYNIFAGSSPDRYTIDDCVIECNHFLNQQDSPLEDGASFNIGNISKGRFESNVVEHAPGSIGISSGTIRGNSFLRGGGLKLWGTEYGFTRPSQNVSIENNEFSNEIFGNGIHLRTGVLADTIKSNYNSFADSGISPDSLLDPSRGYAIRNDAAGTHDASFNWWGAKEGPSHISGKLLGPIRTSPWITRHYEDHSLCTHCPKLCWPLSTFRKKRPGFHPQVITNVSYIGETCFEPRECIELAALVSFTGGNGKGIPVDFRINDCHYRVYTKVGGFACTKIGCLCRGTYPLMIRAGERTANASIHVSCLCGRKSL